MDTIQVHSRVGADGVLKLSLPLGPTDANTDVVITIQPAATSSVRSPEREWNKFLDDTFGSCAELGVERGPQGEYETREKLS